LLGVQQAENVKDVVKEKYSCLEKEEPSVFKTDERMKTV
jgi:hypothetical protein